MPNASDGGAVPIEGQRLDEAVAVLQSSLRRRSWGSHSFDIALGGIMALLGVALVVWLWWEGLQRKKRRAEQLAAADVSHTMDVPTLKRILGEANLPSWMRFPDYERVGWINEALGQLWPHVAAAGAAAVREALGPQLAAAKPSWMSDIALATFTLGDRAPRVSGVKVYKKEAVMEELVLELDLSWTGNQRFQLRIEPLPRIPVPFNVGRLLAKLISFRVGVADLSFHGRVRVTARPLLNKIPVIGAVKVALVERPSFGYNLIVQGGDITIVPGLEAFINSFIQERVLQPYVVPEGFTLPLTPGAGHDIPAGILFLSVLGAENVPRVDWFARSDPYVKLWIRSSRRARRTSIKPDCMAPEWVEDFELLVRDPEQDCLTLALWDHNGVGPDEELGRTQLKLSELPSGEIKDLWLELGNPSYHVSGMNPLALGIQGIRQGRRVLSTALRHMPVIGHKIPPCRVHVEATYYAIGAKELRAVQQGGDIADVVQQEASRGGEEGVSDEHASRVANMLRGGVLFVKVLKSPDESGPVTAEAPPRKASQVRVTIDEQTKATAECEGGRSEEFEESLEFALGGDLADDEDMAIEVECYDYHWMNLEDQNLTWGTRLGGLELPTEGRLHLNLKEMVRRRKVHDVWRLDNIPQGFVELDISWVPILDATTA